MTTPWRQGGGKGSQLCAPLTLYMQQAAGWTAVHSAFMLAPPHTTSIQRLFKFIKLHGD